MYRFNIPIPPDEDFPEVVVAQRMGEGFKEEHVEYAPRWRFDKMRRAVVADEKFFYAMADTSERLQAENTKLRELADLLLWGIDNDVPPAEGLVWSQKVNVLVRELGIVVNG